MEWDETHRLILSRFPPIDLFDDIADPTDWEMLARAEARTNPRIYEEIGDLSQVAVGRRISGPGASWTMAAFTHISPDRTSRFSDGSYGVYYAGDALETALMEHCYHMGRFYRQTGETAGWISQVRQLVGSIATGLHDVRGQGFDGILDPDPQNYAPAQAFAREVRRQGSNGIIYPSQRRREGTCVAIFHPDVAGPARQGAHFRYHWNGDAIDYVQTLAGKRQVYNLTQD